MDKLAGMNGLRAIGAVKAVVAYSGGNDEGGADSITLTMSDGTEKPFQTDQHSVYEYQGQKWTYDRSAPDNRRLATPDEIAASDLAGLLEEPVYDEYYSFAGDFHAYGTVTWDVAADTVVMDKNESVEHYESSSSSW